MRKIFSAKVWFWVVIAGIVLALSYSVYSDFNTKVQCGSSGGATSYLSLRSIDPAQNQIRSGLSIMPYNAKEDTLEVSTVTPGGGPKSRNYDSVFKLSPTEVNEQDPNGPDSSNQPWKINLWQSSRPFFYPFESYQINVFIDFKKNGKSVPLNLTTIDRVDQVIIAKCVPGYSFETATPDLNGFTVVLRRHLFIRLTAVILYGAAVLFLFYIFRREKAEQVFASSIGYVVVLWGIRGIIVGPTNPFPTILDFCTVVLYLVVVAILIHRWLITVEPAKGQNLDPLLKQVETDLALLAKAIGKKSES
jgi:hypothetical protein